MNNLLIYTILAAGNNEGEDTIWMQILVLVILAGAFGIYSFAKAKANKFKEQHEQDYSAKAYSRKYKYRQHWKFQPLLEHGEPSPSVSIAEQSVSKRSETKQPVLDFYTSDKTAKAIPERKLAKKTDKNLHGGMELLELNFILSIVENTDGEDEKDITIRKLNFKELLRRGKLNKASSNALKIYAVNKGNRYSKDIQCEAMKTLAERTMVRSKQ